MPKAHSAHAPEAAAATAPQGAGRHHRPHSRKAAARGHGIRLSSFSAIGMTVFLAGLALQGALIRAGAGPDLSYAGQAVFSIELSFLLNRSLTWRGRSVSLAAGALRWNAQKLALTVPNLIGYALLVRAGLDWLAANLAITALFTLVNYTGADTWAFRYAGRARRRPGWLPGGRHPAVPPARAAAPPPPGEAATPPPGQAAVAPPPGEPWLPPVSLVIPCKDSAATIRATVEGVLAQDYPALAEVILVGSTGDSSWAALEGITDPRLTILEQEPVPGRRDPAVKRDKGIRKASSEVIGLLDSDIVMEPGWLSRAVGLLGLQGREGVVCGGMRSIHDTFWGRFVDRNRLVAKTPRVPAPYYVTMGNFGRHNRKPPITANVIFARDVYESAAFNPHWSHGYEDYEWFWRVVKAGHKVLLSDHLDGRHHHRRSFTGLVSEYARSADGCARFVRAHSDSPLARKRRRQAAWLPAAAAGTAGIAVTGVLTGHILAVALAAAAGFGALMSREFRYSRTAESFGYPVIGAALGLVFTASLTRGLARSRTEMRHAAAVPRTRQPAEWPDWAAKHPRPARRVPWPLVAVLALQAALSLSLVWSNTAFGDEGLYLWLGHVEWAHWLHGRPLPTYGNYSGAPAVYPPLAALADHAGGLAGARLLSLAFMLGATALLYAVTRRLVSQRAAWFAAAFWATSEPAIKLGAFATYDPMAVFLLCLAAWLVVQASVRRRHGELVVLAAVAAALADLTAYSYTIMDLSLVAVAFFAWVPRAGRRKAAVSAAWLAGLTGALFATAMTGMRLWRGLVNTTIDRAHGTGQGVLLVVRSSWGWTGLIVVFAVLGVLLSRRERSWHKTGLLAALTASAFLVPAYQACLHTAWSLDNHLAPGAWLAAAAASYALDVLFSAALRVVPALAAAGACLVALTFPAVTGYSQASVQFHWWPDTAALDRVLGRLARQAHGNIVIENYQHLAQEYYLPQGHDWWRLRDVSFLGTGGPGYFARALSSHHVSLIALDFRGAQDCAIEQALRSSGYYRTYRQSPAVNAPYHDGVDAYVVWVRAASRQNGSAAGQFLTPGCPAATIHYGGRDYRVSIRRPYGPDSNLFRVSITGPGSP